jgi:alkylated DNA repair dioxygenase AlkB
MKSPTTGKEMELMIEKSSLNYKNEIYDINYHYYKCIDSGEQYTTTELDEININQVYDQYNKKYNPFLIKKYITENLFDLLRDKVNWNNYNAPRDESFMSNDNLEYTYGKGFTRTYSSIPFIPEVEKILNKLNNDYNSDYNVCFLNYYKNNQNHLGWHSDDSPEMDNDHPIAVISFGADRYIYTKEILYKGEVPDKDKYLLTNGSLFIMPKGYQSTHLHKIPKADYNCSGRISLTFRKYKIN